MAITPTREQFTEFAQGRQEGEVVMINLLHFDRSGASEGSDSGETPATPTTTRLRARTPIGTTAFR